MSDGLIKEFYRVSAEADRLRKTGKSIVFVSGNFNVIHPGHLRFLTFAANSGDYLIVGVNRDQAPAVYVPEALRLEGIKNLTIVDDSCLLPYPLEDCINLLKPDIIVKGKEYENTYNKEKDLLNNFGGRLIFSSGEIRFSSMELLQRELSEINRATINKPDDFLIRHQTSVPSLIEITKRFNQLKVVVIGDLIVDEYITCDPLGMSQEDPTIVVTPIRNDVFVGGAGIVAAHAKGLGAEVKYYGIVGRDQIADEVKLSLKKHGVESRLFEDVSRKTTLKQRYRSRGKTLLRVSHLHQHEISNELSDTIFSSLADDIKSADLLVFSDFNYGCLPQGLIDKIITHCQKHNVPMTADSQSSSQVGDISRYYGMMLVTPTEHEARLAIRNKDLGLAALAQELRLKSGNKNVFITLGGEGLLIDSESLPGKEVVTDLLPAFNLAPKDVAGAGDSLLICASLALATGATGWEAAYLGSIAAACQVGRVGNFPLTADEIIQELVY